MGKSLPPPRELLVAYAEGYFPMPHPDTDEILWFRPEPRAVLPLDGFHVSKSLKKEIKRGDFEVTKNKAFARVMEECGNRDETWITDEFKSRYGELHQLGAAHSLEVWDKSGELIGGVYGVHVASAFFAESMFHRRTNASKIALFHLVEHLRTQGFRLLEIQFPTSHLVSLGAKEVSDLEYRKLLSRALQYKATY